MHTEACSLREIDLSSSLRAFRTLPIGVTVWQLRDPNDLRSLRLIDANPAAEREFRAPLGFAVGKPIVECFPKLLDTPLPERCRRVVLSGKPETLGEFAYRDARIPEGVFWADVFPLPDRSVGLALENITERKRTTQNQTRALQLLHRVTVHLNEMPALLQAAQFCVDEICAQIGWPVGHFFLSDEACGSHFLPNPVWHLSDTNRFRFSARQPNFSNATLPTNSRSNTVPCRGTRPDSLDRSGFPSLKAIFSAVCWNSRRKACFHSTSMSFARSRMSDFSSARCSRANASRASIALIMIRCSREIPVTSRRLSLPAKRFGPPLLRRASC
jgi:hypothetical protein